VSETVTAREPRNGINPSAATDETGENGALQARNLTLAYDDHIVVEELDLTVRRGEITVLVGANGSGKSTLLRALSRLLAPRGGVVLLDGGDIAARPTREVARRLSVLPQSHVAPEGLTVLDLVKQGRYPHQGFLRQWSADDEQHVHDALAMTGLEDLAERAVDTLSGGQRQRAWIAMTLAQDTSILLLDEPITYLDMNHQIELLDLLARLNEEEERTIVMVLHDVNLAARYAHRIVVVHERGVFAQGPPDDVVTPAIIREVFGIDAQVGRCPVFGTPLCIAYAAMGGSARQRPTKDPARSVSAAPRTREG
jgi:iron complex transport system ATP-binding protein